MGRLMCLDIGDKRIGVAVSDPMGITAQGIETWTRRSIREDAEHFKALADQLDVEKLVVGLPRNMDGSFGFQSKKVRNYAGKIGEMLGVPVVFFDERLTTAAAGQVLLMADVSRGKRRGVVDKMAAVLILQSYMGSEAARRKGKTDG